MEDVLLDEVLGDDIDEGKGISLGALGSGDEGLVRCGGSGGQVSLSDECLLNRRVRQGTIRVLLEETDDDGASGNVSVELSLLGEGVSGGSALLVYPSDDACTAWCIVG